MICGGERCDRDRTGCLLDGPSIKATLVCVGVAFTLCKLVRGRKLRTVAGIWPALVVAGANAGVGSIFLRNGLFECKLALRCKSVADSLQFFTKRPYRLSS